MEKIAIVFCLHGDEPYGMEVLARLPAVSFFLGNARALSERRRFIDADLNRCFPGKADGNYEERRAFVLARELKEFDYVIDLHSSSGDCPLFGIITKPNGEKIELVRRLGLKRLVIMPEFFASGKSMIDFVRCGISLEIGPHGRKENVDQVAGAINNLASGGGRNDEIEILEVFDVVKKKAENIIAKNFVPVKAGEVIACDGENKQTAGYDFVPVLVGEKSYDGILCLACRRVDNVYKSPLPEASMAKEFTVTPYEVSGDIDYDKLVKEFGITPMKELPEVFNKNLLFRRKIVFAHRDIQRILEAIRGKKPFVMMTGLMPTGKFHFGHAMLAQQMIFYQQLGAKIYIAVADIEAYNARGQSLEDSRKIAVEEYIKNYIALGLKPENCEIYFQSERSKDAGKANAYYRLQNLLARYATFNEFKAVYGEISPGKMLAALLQAADMLHPQLPEFEGTMPVVVPVGVDQDPHLRIARDIAQRVNGKGFNFVQLSSTYHTFMPGLKGGKMSSSDPTSFVALTESPSDVEKKIKKYAFSGGKDTLEEHRKSGGNPDIDVSFQYLKMFFEPDDKKLGKIEKDYRSGKLLSGELKQILIDKVNDFLKEHQKKRKLAEKQVEKFI